MKWRTTAVRRLQLRHLWTAILASALPLVALDVRAEEERYPDGWPSWSGMSADCREVFGTYIDPNVMRWDSNETTDTGVTVRRGGRLDAAWWAFGIRSDALRLNTSREVRRSFSLARHGDEVVLDYYVEGLRAESLTIGEGKWLCTVDGLSLVTRERFGNIIDAPGHAKTTLTVTLYRIGPQLYVKSSSHADLRLFDFLPWREEDVRWYRFESTP